MTLYQVARPVARQEEGTRTATSSPRVGVHKGDIEVAEKSGSDIYWNSSGARDVVLGTC